VQAEVASDRTRSSGFEKEDSDARPVSQVEGVVETSPRRLLGGKKRHMAGPLKSTLSTASGCKRASATKRRNLNKRIVQRRLLIDSADQYLNQLVCGV
jgi:hypothetical protein